MRTSTRQYFLARWHGTIPLPRLLWRDTVAVGSLINLTAALASVIAMGSWGGNRRGRRDLLLSPAYNLFLLFAVWRTSERVAEPDRTIARIVAALWILVVTVV